MQPDRSAAVPKFGDWDEKNPESADGYTHIFNQVREQRLMEAGKSPAVGNERSYTAARKQNTDDDIKVSFSISILVSRDLLYLFLAIIPDLPLFFFFFF